MKTKLILFATLFSIKTFAAATLKISAVGDVMMGSSYPSAAMLPPNQGATLWSVAKDYMNGSDIKFLNFEGTFFDGNPQPDGKATGPNRFLFRTPTQYVQNLVDVGINVVTLANNHSRDFGQAGLNSTKATLANNNIQFTGKKANEVAYFRNADFRVAFVGVDFYTGERSIRTSASTLAEIKSLKQKGYLVIVAAHVGGEGDNAILVSNGDEIFLGENRGDSRKFAIEAIQAGADALIMSGPHVPRGIELYNGKIIFYSLGNFMTGRGLLVGGRAGIAPMANFELDQQGNFVAGRIISFKQSHNPHEILIDKNQEAYNLMKGLSQKQFPYSKLAFGQNGEINLN